MTTGDEQTAFKNAVKQWLKSHGLDYRWVAERCGVSEITVRNWMSQKNIPPLKRQLLERVMVQLPALDEGVAATVPGVEVNASLSLTVQLAPELYLKLSERARAMGLTVEVLVAQAIAELVNKPEDKSALADMTTREVLLPPRE